MPTSFAQTNDDFVSRVFRLPWIMILIMLGLGIVMSCKVYKDVPVN